MHSDGVFGVFMGFGVSGFQGGWEYHAWVALGEHAISKEGILSIA